MDNTDYLESEDDGSDRAIICCLARYAGNREILKASRSLYSKFGMREINLTHDWLTSYNDHLNMEPWIVIHSYFNELFRAVFQPHGIVFDGDIKEPQLYLDLSLVSINHLGPALDLDVERVSEIVRLAEYELAERRGIQIRVRRQILTLH